MIEKVWLNGKLISEHEVSGVQNDIGTRRKGLGDLAGSVATPIARALNLPCVDPLTGQLKPESRCAKRKAKLNDFSEAIYDYLWPSSKPKE